MDSDHFLLFVWLLCSPKQFRIRYSSEKVVRAGAPGALRRAGKNSNLLASP